VLDAFATPYPPAPCTFYSANITGSFSNPCRPDGTINLDDILAVLNAFAGQPYPCYPPCTGFLLEMGAGDGPAGGESPPAATGTIRLARNYSAGSPGLVAVDVFLSGASDLRGYQISLEALAGPQGHGRLELDDFVIDPDRTDYVYRDQIPSGASPGAPYVYTSVDRVGGRIAVALPQGGATVAGESYVGTVVMRREAGAQGRFYIRHRPEHTLLRDSGGRAIEVTDNGGADIDVPGAP